MFRKRYVLRWREGPYGANQPAGELKAVRLNGLVLHATGTGEFAFSNSLRRES